MIINIQIRGQRRCKPGLETPKERIASTKAECWFICTTCIFNFASLVPKQLSLRSLNSFFFHPFLFFFSITILGVVFFFAMQAYFPFAPSFSGAGRRRKENEGLALRVHGKDVKFSIRQGMMVRREKKKGGIHRTHVPLGERER